MAGCSENTGMTPSQADELSENLLVRILSRVPYKSLCRFKCVSTRWLRIISHPDHRKVLPQYHLDLDALAGVLYSTEALGSLGYPVHHFTSVSAGGRPPIDPSLPFLPSCDRFELLDSCNGLLLCHCFNTTDSRSFNYVVCNPATEKWVVLPGCFNEIACTARLGFDPAVSSHFHVFKFVKGYLEDDIKGVEIYSSKTGAWSHKDNNWGLQTRIDSDSKSVFVNGMLYLVATDSEVPSVVNVDVEGTTWRMISIPQHENYHFGDIDVGFIDLSQGRLYFANRDRADMEKLSIWVLEDFSSEKWILKHTVRYFNLFGVNNDNSDYTIVLIHPERNTLLSVYGHDNKVLMSYKMEATSHRSVERGLAYIVTRN